MNLGRHFELIALIERFFDEGISEEEWALLQIHMAYCTDCQRAFATRGAASIVPHQPNSLN